MQLWPSPPVVTNVLPIQVFGHGDVLELYSVKSGWLPSAVLLWMVFPIAPDCITIPLTPLSDTVLFCTKLYCGSVSLTEFTFIPSWPLLAAMLPEVWVPV